MAFGPPCHEQDSTSANRWMARIIVEKLVRIAPSPGHGPAIGGKGAQVHSDAKRRSGPEGESAVAATCDGGARQPARHRPPKWMRRQIPGFARSHPPRVAGLAMNAAGGDLVLDRHHIVTQRGLQRCEEGAGTGFVAAGHHHLHAAEHAVVDRRRDQAVEHLRLDPVHLQARADGFGRQAFREGPDRDQIARVGL